MNPTLVNTLLAAKNSAQWQNVADILSGPTRRHASINLKEIDAQSKEGDIIIVPGKVLGSGSLNKKITVCALHFSASAREKAKGNKSEFITILDEIKKNPKAEGVKIIQ